jgi:hypothetical protein
MSKSDHPPLQTIGDETIPRIPHRVFTRRKLTSQTVVRPAKRSQTDPQPLFASMAHSHSGSAYDTDEDTELASALLDSENAYLEEQRAILKRIEEENNYKTTSQQDQQSWCEETFASTRSSVWSTLDHSKNDQLDHTTSHSVEGYEDQAIYVLNGDDALKDDDMRIPEQLFMLEGGQGTLRRGFHTNPAPANEIPYDEVIQEQIRILQEIQAQDVSAKQPTAKVTPSPRSATRIPSSKAMVEQVDGISVKAPSSKDDSSKSSSYQDLNLQLENGCKLRVKGTKHVYKSISAGTAVLTMCTVCGTVSQVNANCKALYCTCCHQVSPMHAPSDAEIARAIQRQEKEVAYHSKMADGNPRAD